MIIAKLKRNGSRAKTKPDKTNQLYVTQTWWQSGKANTFASQNKPAKVIAASEVQRLATMTTSQLSQPYFAIYSNIGQM